MSRASVRCDCSTTTLASVQAGPRVIVTDIAFKSLAHRNGVKAGLWHAIKNGCHSYQCNRTICSSDIYELSAEKRICLPGDEVLAINEVACNPSNCLLALQHISYATSVRLSLRREQASGEQCLLIVPLNCGKGAFDPPIMRPRHLQPSSLTNVSPDWKAKAKMESVGGRPIQMSLDATDVHKHEWEIGLGNSSAPRADTVDPKLGTLDGSYQHHRKPHDHNYEHHSTAKSQRGHHSRNASPTHHSDHQRRSHHHNGAQDRRHSSDGNRDKHHSGHSKLHSHHTHAHHAHRHSSKSEHSSRAPIHVEATDHAAPRTSRSPGQGGARESSGEMLLPSPIYQRLKTASDEGALPSPKLSRHAKISDWVEVGEVDVGSGHGEEGGHTLPEDSHGPWLSPAKQDKLTFQELDAIFRTLDHQGKGYVTHPELIAGLRKRPWAAGKMGMSENVGC